MADNTGRQDDTNYEELDEDADRDLQESLGMSDEDRDEDMRGMA